MVTAAESTFPAEAESAVLVRRWAFSQLVASGVDGSTPDALLVVSELVTNAIRHGCGPLRVMIDRRGDVVRIEVTDSGPGRPEPAPRDPDSTRGRGLMIVSELACVWGVDHRTRGKTVWADVPA